MSAIPEACEYQGDFGNRVELAITFGNSFTYSNSDSNAYSNTDPNTDPNNNDDPIGQQI